MSAPKPPQVVTANMLVAGDVAYLTAQNQWSTSITQAEVLTTVETAAARLEFAKQSPNEIVGVYLTAVKLENNRPVPTHFREEFRARGPSNYPHGKQENQHV